MIVARLSAVSAARRSASAVAGTSRPAAASSSRPAVVDLARPRRHVGQVARHLVVRRAVRGGLDDREHRAGVAEVPLHLLGRRGLVDRDGDGAGGPDRVVAERPLVAGPAHQRHPVAGLHARARPARRPAPRPRSANSFGGHRHPPPAAAPGEQRPRPAPRPRAAATASSRQASSAARRPRCCVLLHRGSSPVGARCGPPGPGGSATRSAGHAASRPGRAGEPPGPARSCREQPCGTSSAGARLPPLLGLGPPRRAVVHPVLPRPAAAERSPAAEPASRRVPPPVPSAVPHLVPSRDPHPWSSSALHPRPSRARRRAGRGGAGPGLAVHRLRAPQPAGRRGLRRPAARGFLAGLRDARAAAASRCPVVGDLSRLAPRPARRRRGLRRWCWRSCCSSRWSAGWLTREPDGRRGRTRRWGLASGDRTEEDRVADQTSSSLTIAAPPQDVLRGDRRPARLPGVERRDQGASRCSRPGADGRPRRARFSISSTGMTDEYTLDYAWAPTACSWQLVAPEHAAEVAGRLVPLVPTSRRHRGALRPQDRRADPDDRADAAQDREADRRRGAEGAEEAGRGARVASRAPSRGGVVRVLLFTGKGGVGKTTTAAATAARPQPAAARRSCCPPTPPTRSPTPSGCRLTGEPTEVDTGLYAMQVDTQAAFERSWHEVQGYLRGVLARAGVDAGAGRGAHGPARRGGGPRPARAAQPGRVRPLGPRRRRLRPDRRDAAAAGAARGAAVVRRQGVPGAPPGAAGGRARCWGAAGPRCRSTACSRPSSGCTASSPTSGRCSPRRTPPYGWCSPRRRSSWPRPGAR